MDRESLLAYRIRTVKVGFQITFALLVALIVFRALPGGSVADRNAFEALWYLTAAATTAWVVLPWERVLRRPRGIWLLYLWSAADIVLISVLIAMSGDAYRIPFLLYGLTTVFFAASYRRRVQIALFAFTCVCYLAASNIADSIVSPAEQFLRLTILGLLAYMSSFLSRELIRQTSSRSQANSLLQAALEATNDGILVVNTVGEITAFNKKFVEMWSIPDEVIESRDDNRALAVVLDQLVDPDAFLEKARALYASEDESYDVLHFKDGRLFHRYSKPQCLGDEVVGRVWSFQDVTQRVAAERQIATAIEALERANVERGRLLTHLVKAKEEERNRVASDIHDDSVQVMTSVAISLERLARRVKDDGLRASLEGLEQAARSAISRLRSMVFELRPPTLDEEGLASALRLYLEELQLESGIAYELDNQLASEPDPASRVVLYRIAQEALTNVRKHSGASRVRIELAQLDGGVTMEVSDDGVGFRQDSLVALPGHIGLAEMRERAETAGGSLEINPQPGTGTRIRAWVPAPSRVGTPD